MGISLAKETALVAGAGGGGGGAVNGFATGGGTTNPVEVAAAWLASGIPAVARELGNP